VLVPFGAIAHAELDTEIYSEADEQNEQCNRDQIERADQDETESSRHRKPDHQAKEDRSDDLPGVKRQPENDHNAEHCRQRVAPGAVSDDRELIIIHRHLTG
jgi:hypothetical protein